MPSFKNKYQLTEEIYVNQNSISKWHYAWLILLSIFAIFLLITKQWVSVFITVIISICVVVALVRSKRRAVEEYKALMLSSDNQPIEIEVCFYNNRFVVKNSLKYKEEFDYSSIIRSKRFGDLSIFKTDKKTAFSIKRDCFEIGTREDFDYFMNIKGFKV